MNSVRNVTLHHLFLQIAKFQKNSILHVDFNVTTSPLTLTDPSPQNGQTRNAHENNVPQGNIYEHRNYGFENTPDLEK